ncbi:MAG: M3 family peptidase [Deltaproteobacteria bacterium]|nr:MAG: M3 family peptidase [Deltaproteobacteria bacterium]
MNPLLEKFDTKFETVPFDKIKNEHFLPAIKEAIKKAKEDINNIKDNTDEPDFYNVIVAMENASERVYTISGVFFNLHSAETNDELTKLAKDFSPLVTEFGNDIILDEGLFKKVQAVFEKMEEADLSLEQKMLLEKTYKDFKRNGALLSHEDKEKLRELDKELSSLGLLFGDHILNDTNSFELILSNIDDLKGCPESYIESAAHMAEEKGYEKQWLLTLDYPSYIPFMTYADNRDLRKRLSIAFGSRGFKNGKNDNKEIVKKLVNLRYVRAQLLGYNSHSDFILEERMAGDTKTVMNFLDEMLSYARPAAKKELVQLSEYAKANGGPETLQSWDFGYWKEKLKQENFDINDEMLRPYFKLEKVLQGVFDVAHKLYGLNYKKVDGVAVYHQDVEVFDVTDKGGKHMGVFYADFFPRPGKRGGAWMTSFRDQKTKDGVDQRPHISIVCNFTKPSGDRPSLLTFNEVTTLFHEFGHSLHGMLSHCSYSSTSGTNVFWDFVELPSQIMENWAFEKECLDLFAEHFKTGEKIPEELIKKIKDSASFFEGCASVRQAGLARLDMAWHKDDPKGIDNVDAFEREVSEPTRLFPAVEGVNTSVSFSHIFAGGYSSGYYSYKWAEVLDADAFELFKEKGIFNPEVADSFKENILSKGGTEHPMELYEKFRGRKPSTHALLKRGGLLPH